jgi:hypothetical protein
MKEGEIAASHEDLQEFFSCRIEMMAFDRYNFLKEPSL